MLKQTVTAVVFAAVLLAAISAHAAGDALSAARDLYASAAYEDALKMLDSLATEQQPREERHAISLYRALCLVALGRDADASHAMEAIVTDDPFYHPSTEDLPPRVQDMFASTRKRLLPTIIQDRYAAAKTAFDRKEYKTAADGFQQVLDALADPDVGPLADQAPLSDVRTLALGFHDLSARAATPPPAPAPAPPPPAAAPAPDPNRIYSAADAHVVAPVALSQVMPAFPGHVTAMRTGIVEVVIDETGAVESVTMPMPIEPAFDSHVQSEARKWRYRPATLNGKPVKFRKRIQIALTPSA